MGVWGTGLYSGDFAKDLSSAARAISQLPFNGDKLAELLCSSEPGAAYNAADEDYTAFWLVLADQFAKRGLACDRVREKALAIIDNGEDLARLSRLGMDTAGLHKRKKILSDLRDRIVNSTPPATPRRVLKKPQPLLMNVGDVVIYPTARGHQINPHFPSVERMKPEWIQDGWGAAVIVEVGLEFDFLAWYRPLTFANAMSAKPDLQKVLANETWVLRLPGTCSASHYKKMRMEKVGLVTIDREKLNRCFSEQPRGRSAAVNDISIANRLSVGPAFPTERIQLTREMSGTKARHQHEGIRSIEEILACTE